MLEINRCRYMDEATAEKSSNFESATVVVAELVATAVLFEAFRHTNFVADVPNQRVRIRVGERCTPLDELLDTRGVVDWAFVTAYNPSGRQASADTNQRADQELVEDTFRVLSISFSYMDGAESITDFLDQEGHPDYSYIIYMNLGDLYLEKERYVDAAETYDAVALELANA